MKLLATLATVILVYSAAVVPAAARLAANGVNLNGHNLNGVHLNGRGIGTAAAPTGGVRVLSVELPADR